MLGCVVCGISCQWAMCPWVTLVVCGVQALLAGEARRLADKARAARLASIRSQLAGPTAPGIVPIDGKVGLLCCRCMHMCATACMVRIVW